MTRYPNIWSRDAERRMRLYSVGTEYDSYPARSRQKIRGSTNPKLGMSYLSPSAYVFLTCSQEQ